MARCRLRKRRFHRADRGTLCARGGAGTHPSEAQIAYARTRSGVRLTQFRRGDAQALPFTDGKFDAATMALVISLIPVSAKAVAEMARVARPDGWVATYMWDPDGGIHLEPLHAAMQSMSISYQMHPAARRPG